MTYVVGLTGGIGSGKSTVAAFFAKLGVPIIDADIIARDLVIPGQATFNAITAHFGPTILDSQGNINRPLLRDIIFNQPDKRAWLEALLHPLIYLALRQEISKVTAPYCIVVVPLLAEHYALYQSAFDHIIVVNTTEAHQLRWTTKRDHCDENLVKKIIQTQASSEERIKIADTVLSNKGNFEELENEVKNLHLLFSQYPTS